MFISLLKADAAKRLVYGSIDETPDRAGEVLDYPTAKPAFQDWSDGMSKASGGKNLGNVRAQHDLKKAAGHLVEIGFDDDAKRIDFCAFITDDQEWSKVELGTYTGFSPGGSYAKRWQDGAYRRYTPTVGELSIVDMPCIKTGTFTMIKADGAEEEIEFVLAKAYEPGNEATKERADELAKAAGDDAKGKDFVVQARADLIAENALAELAKMNTDPEAAPEPVADVAEPKPVADLSALDAVLAKGDAAIAAAQGVTAPPEAQAANPLTEDLAKGLAEIATALDGKTMLKGLRGINSLSSVMYQLVAVHAEIAREAAAEGDNSGVPASVAGAITTLGGALVQMAQEEVAELLADINMDGLQTEVMDWSIYECAAPIVDRVKADTALMEKAGARNSASDATRLQTIHDKACEMGAACATEMAKAAALAEENDVLAKAVSEVTPKIEKLVEQVEQLTADRTADLAKVANLEAEVERLGNAAAPAKGVLISLTKGADATGADPDAKPLTELQRIRAMPPGSAKAAAILNRSGVSISQ